jgi:DNA-binding CsgD family transcriptional regulator
MTRKTRQDDGTVSAPDALPVAAMESVFALWDELERFPVDKSDDALGHLAKRLRGLLRADNIKWLGVIRVLRGSTARRDDLLGWRIRSTYELFEDPPNYRKLTACWFRRDNQMDPGFLYGHATLAMVKGLGKFQSHRMRDGWIPFEEFQSSKHYRIHYTDLNITDRIWLSVPLNADSESMFLVDRHGDSPHFTKTEEILAATILRGIRRFHCRLFLERGLFIGEHELSPVSRRILQKLLTGMSEKEIAQALNQTPATTHKYIKTIYHRFGVNGRAELMALWLGPQAAPADGHSVSHPELS